MATHVADLTETSTTVMTQPPASSIILVQDLWKTYDMGSEQQVQALLRMRGRLERPRGAVP